MGIKKLKKENDFLNMTLIDMLGKFDTSKTKKYTQLLVKLLNKKIEQQNLENEYLMSKSHNEAQINPIDRVLPHGCWENMVTRNFICDYVFSWGNMERFVEFTELMDKNLISENDISQYDSWEMLETNLFEAKNREMFKKSKKEIHRIYEDQNYLIFKPLTYMSSCSYGYQTKWCTAMINDASYFYNHSRGILIYLIDKKENKKFAFYKHCPDYFELEFSEHENYVFKTFNQEDKQIDTIQTGLPLSILEIILRETDLKLPTTIPNYKLFSDDEKNKMRGYYGKLPNEIGQPRIYGSGEQEETVDPELPVCDMVMEEREVTAVTLQARLVPMPVVQRFPTELDNDIVSECSSHVLRQLEEHIIKHYGESEQ
jgi:hypothetical protein